MERTSINVVQSISHPVELCEEIVAENVLGVGADSFRERFNTDILIELLDCSRSNDGLLALEKTKCAAARVRSWWNETTHSNIIHSEKELSIEIANLDLIHVGDLYEAALTACYTHHREVLQQLTTDRTWADSVDTGKRTTIISGSHLHQPRTISGMPAPPGISNRKLQPGRRIGNYAKRRHILSRRLIILNTSKLPGRSPPSLVSRCRNDSNFQVAHRHCPGRATASRVSCDE